MSPQHRADAPLFGLEQAACSSERNQFWVCKGRNLLPGRTPNVETAYLPALARGADRVILASAP